MLREIGTVDQIPEYINRAKDKSDPFRLMGFGHRVYKNFDPRAKVMKESADEVLALMGIENNPTLQVAKELERIALEDEYFIEKKLYPNVDFYSGIILDAIGFQTSMFTPIFALARTVGWIAQWQEMIADEKQRIGRPRQLYIGHGERDYVDVENRLVAQNVRNAAKKLAQIRSSRNLNAFVPNFRHSSYRYMDLSVAE